MAVAFWPQRLLCQAVTGGACNGRAQERVVEWAVDSSCFVQRADFQLFCPGQGICYQGMARGIEIADGARLEPLQCQLMG